MRAYYKKGLDGLNKGRIGLQRRISGISLILALKALIRSTAPLTGRGAMQVALGKHASQLTMRNVEGMAA